MSLGPLGTRSFGAIGSSVKVMQHPAIVQDDKALVEAVVEMIGVIEDLLPPFVDSFVDVRPQQIG